MYRILGGAKIHKVRKLKSKYIHVCVFFIQEENTQYGDDQYLGACYGSISCPGQIYL